MNTVDPAFFSDFGIDLTVNGVPVRGIFDNAFGSAFGGMIDGTGPMVRLPSSTAAGIVKRGDAVVIGSTGYTVTTVEPDGTGLALLRLEEA